MKHKPSKNVVKRLHFFTLSLLILSILSSGCIRKKRYANDLRGLEARKAATILNQRQKAEAQQIDSLLHAHYAQKDFNGSILVAEKGKIIYKAAFGYKDLDEKDSLSINSTFQLASVSKMFTATAIMMLQEDGLLEYDDDIRTYIAEFPYEGITIRQLLNHRSGLPRYMFLADQHWDSKKPLSNEAMIQLFAEHQPPVYYRPNRRFYYCNTNYALLASITERIANIPFEQFVAKRIFVPLQMQNSLVYNKCKNPEIPNEAIGHIGYRKSYVRQVDHHYLDGVVGDKGVYSTVEDLFKFDQALYSEKLVKRETLEEAFCAAGNETKSHHLYGFGWRIYEGDENIVYHFGWWKGFRTCFIRYLDEQRTVIALNNKDRIRTAHEYWRIAMEPNQLHKLPEPQIVKDEKGRSTQQGGS